MSYDFHTHTTFSDGTLSPENLISKAFERGIKVIAVTDHDTISSFQQNLESCNKYNIELVKGIEISTRMDERDIHILAYFYLETDFFKLKENMYQNEHQECSTKRHRLMWSRSRYLS